ncbi:MAG TPA: DegT/DnrJ/EryC1/StrS family aminotransferase [Baekduia sp.]|nr:DegT/DnrJ/EryC1/StrS family aminotransferase [Baekduia sp.]
MPFVDLLAQQRALAPELEPVLRSMFDEADWVLGRQLGAFERELADLCEVEHGVGTDSGLSALELILRAAGVGPGDEVITTANTFIATALAISHAGAWPVLVDVDPHTANIDPAALERAVGPRTRAVIVVHLYGQPADMDAVRAIADRHGLLVVEDACQAHGARYRGRRAGSLGDAAAFSFYPSKNLGAFGDGGAVVTRDAGLADAVRTLRDYGQREKHDHVVKGFNRRLDTLQAALLRVKLRHLDAWNARRREHAAVYAALLERSGLTVPRPPADVEPVWHLYVIEDDDRDRLRAALAQRGIQTGIHYPVPVHLQAAYADLGLGTGSFPVTERRAARMLSLPMYPELEPAQIEDVAGAVLEHHAMAAR